MPDTQPIHADAPVAGLLNLEELIKKHVESIDKIKVELKQQREMYDDSFNNNPTFKEHVEKVKEATKAKLSVKQQIAKQPSVAFLDQRVKDLRFDLKEQQKTLSDLLVDYKEQTGATQLDIFGSSYSLVTTIKLARHTGRS